MRWGWEGQTLSLHHATCALFLLASNYDVSTWLSNLLFWLLHILCNTLKCVRVFSWKLSWYYCLAKAYQYAIEAKQYQTRAKGREQASRQRSALLDF